MITIDALTYAEIGDNLAGHFHELVEYKKSPMDVKLARRAEVVMYSLNHYYGAEEGHDTSSSRCGEEIACSLDAISAHDELHKMPEACQFTLEKAVKKLISNGQNRYTCWTIFVVLYLFFYSFILCRFLNRRILLPCVFFPFLIPYSLFILCFVLCPLSFVLSSCY